MEEYHNNFGASVRAKRIEQGLSQEILAEKVGITPTHIKHIESGHRNPSFEVLYKIAAILNLSIDKAFFPDTMTTEHMIRFQAKQLLEQCSENQLKVIIATMHAMLAE